jgi:hypothetical protein
MQESAVTKEKAAGYKRGAFMIFFDKKVKSYPHYLDCREKMCLHYTFWRVQLCFLKFLSINFVRVIKNSCLKFNFYDTDRRAGQAIDSREWRKNHPTLTLILC